MLTTPLRLLGIALYRAGLGKAIIRWRSNRLRVMAYHACDPLEADFTAGLQVNTTPDEFAAHLDYYGRHYTVISLEDVEVGRVPPYAAVITFDDGYRSVFEHAFPLLRRHRMPATVFLVTRVVGNRCLVWVNELNWMLRRHGPVAKPIVVARVGSGEGQPPADLIDAVRRTCDSVAIDAMLREIRTAIDLDESALAAREGLYLTWQDVDAMKQGGITFGNHTATHPSLPRLSLIGQRLEIEEAGRRLTAAACHPQWIAFPFGDQGQANRAVAEDAGCTVMLGIGNVHGPVDRRHIGRTPVSASNDAELFAQIEIVEPAKAWLRSLLRRDARVRVETRESAPDSGRLDPHDIRRLE